MRFGGTSAGINGFGTQYISRLRRCRQHHDAENSAICTVWTGVGAGKTGLSRIFMQDGNRYMHIKKCSQRTKHLERRLRRMNDPSRGAQAALHHVSASPHRRPRAGPHNTRNRTFANPGIVLNLAHRKTGIVQSENNTIALRQRCGFNPVERNPEALANLSAKAWRSHSVSFISHSAGSPPSDIASE